MQDRLQLLHANCQDRLPAAACKLPVAWSICQHRHRLCHQLLLTTSKCISPLISIASRLIHAQGMRGKSTSNCSTNGNSMWGRQGQGEVWCMCLVELALHIKHLQAERHTHAHHVRLQDSHASMCATWVISDCRRQRACHSASLQCCPAACDFLCCENIRGLTLMSICAPLAVSTTSWLSVCVFKYPSVHRQSQAQNTSNQVSQACSSQLAPATA